MTYFSSGGSEAGRHGYLRLECRPLIPVFSHPGLALLSRSLTTAPSVCRSQPGPQVAWPSPASQPDNSHQGAGARVLRAPKAPWVEGTASRTYSSWGLSQSVPGMSGSPPPGMRSPSLNMLRSHLCPRLAEALSHLHPTSPASV